MYWLSVSKLAKDLREGRVDQKEQFKYYLATFIAWNIFAQLFFHYGESLQIERLIPVVLNLAITIIGIFLCYKANKRGDNKDFITRMICLGWTVGMWGIICFSAIFLILIIAFIPLGGHDPYSVAFGRFLRWSLWIFIFQYYGLLYSCLSWIAQPKGAENPSFKIVWKLRK